MRLALVLLAACSSPVTRPVEPVGVAPSPARPFRVPARSRDVTIAVGAHGVTINGAPVPLAPTVDDLEKLLGKADRVNDKPANVLHTWDRLGLLVYEPHDGRAQTIGLVYVARGMDFDPKQLYAGRMTIDGNPLDRSVTFRTVQGYPGHGSGTSGSSATFKHGSVEVYVGADGTDDPVRIVEISFYNEAGAGAPELDEELDTTPSPSAPREVRSHEVACNRGDAARCTRAGILHQNGTRGLTRNDRRAYAFLTKACGANDAFGCTALGVLHATGRGTPRARPEAIEAFSKACRLGDSLACALAKSH